MADKRHVLFNPHGGTIDLEGKKPLQRIQLSAYVGEWFRQMADFAATQKTGIHCSECGADIVGQNSDDDPMFTVACSCREWVFGNREYTKPMFQ